MADTQLPTVSELHAQIAPNSTGNSPLPSASDLYNQIKQENVDSSPVGMWNHYIGPHQYSGPLADQAFDVGPVGRVMKATGQAAADEWGAMKGVYSQKLYEQMDPEDAKNDKAIVKSGNEGWLRPLAYKVLAQEAANAINATTNIVKPIFAAGAGVIGGVSAAGEELEKSLGKNPVSELARDIGTGAGGDILPEAGHLREAAGSEAIQPNADLRTPSQAPDFNKGDTDFAVGKHGTAETNPARLPTPLDAAQVFADARSKGVVGEGEAGYFNVGPVSPENVKARMEAANDSGQLLLTDQSEKPPEEDYVPSTDELARKINPEAFNKLDSLKDLQENLRLSIQYAAGKGEDVSGLKARLPEIDEQLRDLIPDTADARSRATEMLNSDSPDGDMFRDWVQAQALERALANVKDDVQDAYGRSTDLLKDSATDTTTPAGKAAQKAPRGSKKVNNGTTKSPGPESTPAPTGPDAGSLGRSSGEQTRSADSSRPGTSGTEPVFQTPEEVGISGGEKKVSGAAKSLQEEAISKGLLDSVDFDLPEYRGWSKEEQAPRVAKYVLDHFEEAKKGISGEGEIPRDLNRQLVFVALNDIANKTGDLDLIRSLIKSGLNTEVSEAGSTLAARRGITSTDPINLIQDAEDKLKGQKGDLRYDAKTRTTVSRAIERTKADIAAAVNKATNEFHENWESFLRSIECEE